MQVSAVTPSPPPSGTPWSSTEPSSCRPQAAGMGLRCTMSVPAATTGRLRTTIATSRGACSSTIRTSAQTTASTETAVNQFALFVPLRDYSFAPRGPRRASPKGCRIKLFRIFSTIVVLYSEMYISLRHQINVSHGKEEPL